MEIPLGSVVTAIAALVGVFIASQLHYRRSTRERLWDLRRQAYGVILARLARVERICANIDDIVAMHGGDVYWESDSSTKHSEQIREHMAVMTDRFSDDYLIISKEFVRIFEEFQSELNSGDPNVAADEEENRFGDTIRKYRPLLLAQAVSETKSH